LERGVDGQHSSQRLQGHSVLSVVLIWQRSNPAQPSGPEGPNSLLEPKIIVPGHCKSESWLVVEECVKTIKCKVEQLVLKYQTNRLLASCIGLACCPWSGPRLDQPPIRTYLHTYIHQHPHIGRLPFSRRPTLHHRLPQYSPLSPLLIP
jgi:hypothetical protein